METRETLLTFAALRCAAVPHPGAREGIKPSETRSGAHHHDTGDRNSGYGRASNRYPCRGGGAEVNHRNHRRGVYELSHTQA